MDALRVVVDIRTLSPITATNAIVVTDTPDRVQAAGRIIAAFDKRPAEAVIDVEVLEVNRSKLQEYGVQIASPGSPGIDGSVDINRPNMTLDSLRKLGAGGRVPFRPAGALLPAAADRRRTRARSRTRTCASRTGLRRRRISARTSRSRTRAPCRSRRAAWTSSRRRSSPTEKSASISASRRASIRATTSRCG